MIFSMIFTFLYIYLCNITEKRKTKRKTKTNFSFHRSVPLKSHLSTYTEKGKISVLDFLSAALESAEYERALARGLVGQM